MKPLAVLVRKTIHMLVVMAIVDLEFCLYPVLLPFEISRIGACEISHFQENVSVLPPSPLSPPSWKNVDMISSVINSSPQCPMGDISSFPFSETKDFLTPSSACVEVGLGAGSSIASSSMSTKAKAKAKAIASVDKKLNELYKCSTFSVS